MIGLMKYLRRLRITKERKKAMNNEAKRIGQAVLRSLKYLLY
jgi:hypothetical protein